MQDPGDDDFALRDEIVHRVSGVKHNAQPVRQIRPLRPRERKVPDRLKGGPKRLDTPRSNGFGRLGGKPGPDSCKVGFRRIGKPQAERRFNPCLPRAMMRSISKSTTRPAAMSANPISMSAFNAAKA